MNEHMKNYVVFLDISSVIDILGFINRPVLTSYVTVDSNDCATLYVCAESIDRATDLAAFHLQGTKARIYSVRVAQTESKNEENECQEYHWENDDECQEYHWENDDECAPAGFEEPGHRFN